MNALAVLALTFYALEKIARWRRLYVRGAAQYRQYTPLTGDDA